MVKKKTRASIKGRGRDILFGEETTSPVPPPTTETGEFDLSGHEALLSAEAAAAGPIETPAKPTAGAAEAARPAPPKEKAVEEKPAPTPPSSGEIKAEAAPPAKPEEVTVPFVPPPRMTFSGILTEVTPSEGKLEPPIGPFPSPEAEVISIPKGEPLPPELRAKIIRLVGGARLADLDAEIDKLYRQTSDKLSTNPKLLNEAYTLLREAREIWMQRQEAFDVAELNVQRVEAMLERAERVEAWSWTYGIRIFAYEAAWFIVLLAALIFDKPLAAWIGRMAGVSTTSMSQLFSPWFTLLWGGIGGVVGALYSLHWHIGAQDFDRKYNMSYIVQPFMGVVIGGIVFLIIKTGFLALGQAATESNAASGAVQVAMTYFPALLACLAGFRQSFAYEMIDQIMKVVLRTPPKE